MNFQCQLCVFLILLITILVIIRLMMIIITITIIIIIIITIIIKIILLLIIITWQIDEPVDWKCTLVSLVLPLEKTGVILAKLRVVQVQPVLISVLGETADILQAYINIYCMLRAIAWQQLFSLFFQWETMTYSFCYRRTKMLKYFWYNTCGGLGAGCPVDLSDFPFKVGMIPNLNHFKFRKLYQLVDVVEIRCVAHRHGNDFNALMPQQPKPRKRIRNICISVTWDGSFKKGKNL